MKKYLKFLGFVAAFLGLLGIILLACPAYKNGESGYWFMANHDFFKAVAGVIVAYIFACLGIVAAAFASLLPMFGKEIKVAKISVLDAAAGLILLIAAILFFCGPSMIGSTNYVAAAFPLAGVFTLLAALVSCASAVLPLVLKD